MHLYKSYPIFGSRISAGLFFPLEDEKKSIAAEEISIFIAQFTFAE